MKYFVSVGEMSGDLHLSYLVKSIKNRDNNTSFFGVGGKHAREAGVTVIQDIDELAVMGFVESLKKVSFLKKKAEEYIELIKKENIKNVILIDYGGFNLRFLKLLRERLSDVKIFYYIPPKVWVWGEKRVETLRLVDEIIVIFPWEVEFYKKHGIDAKYYGNPFYEKYKYIEKKGEKGLLLPGSRKQEVIKMSSYMLEYARENLDKKFILKLAKLSHRDWIRVDIPENVEVRQESLEELIKESKYAVAVSGTVVLELSLMGLPGVVVYITSWINIILAKLLIKNLKYISLPNISVDKQVYKELIQKDCTVLNISKAVDELLEGYDKKIEEIDEIRRSLSGDNIMDNYAKLIIKE